MSFRTERVWFPRRLYRHIREIFMVVALRRKISYELGELSQWDERFITQTTYILLFIVMMIHFDVLRRTCSFRRTSSLITEFKFVFYSSQSKAHTRLDSFTSELITKYLNFFHSRQRLSPLDDRHRTKLRRRSVFVIYNFLFFLFHFCCCVDEKFPSMGVRFLFVVRQLIQHQ